MWEGSHVSPGEVTPLPLHIAGFGVWSRFINIERVLCPNYTKCETALPWVMSNKRPKCDVDQINGSWDTRKTWNDQQITCFIVSCVYVLPDCFSDFLTAVSESAVSRKSVVWFLFSYGLYIYRKKLLWTVTTKNTESAHLKTVPITTDCFRIHSPCLKEGTRSDTSGINQVTVKWDVWGCLKSQQLREYISSLMKTYSCRCKGKQSALSELLLTPTPTPPLAPPPSLLHPTPPPPHRVLPSPTCCSVLCAGWGVQPCGNFS